MSPREAQALNSEVRVFQSPDLEMPRIRLSRACGRPLAEGHSTNPVRPRKATACRSATSTWRLF